MSLNLRGRSEEVGYGATLLSVPVLVIGGLFLFIHYKNKSPVKHHNVSRRGRYFEGIGKTNLNDEIGVKNAKAHRLAKLFAGGKYDYSKNSVRDNKSTLYRK